MKNIQPKTGAEAVLMTLKAQGVDYLFANAGTDFPPIIEALATRPEALPEPVTIPHETAAVAMAHGYYLVSGKPQAVMVHVNVGLANAAMGVINAASDNIPVIMMSGRTPITEHGRLGARMTPIQYGQEMYDQTSLVRDVTKFNYEMRYAEQGGQLVNRAVGIAMSEPRGPVYLSLPREPLDEKFPENQPFPPAVQSVAKSNSGNLDDIARAAKLLDAAKSPLVICQRGDVAGETSKALSKLGLPVIEPFTIRNVMASGDPCARGFTLELLKDADVILVVDSAIPWIEKHHRPVDAKIITLGPDPLFQRNPVRSFQSDISILCDPAKAIVALEKAMAPRTKLEPMEAPALAVAEELMDDAWMTQCISDILGDGAIFSELGVVPSMIKFAGPNQLFTAPHSGGLGWAMPAALGAQLFDRSRLTIAAVGDGSYMFANPVACHQIAEALELPLLTIVKNNGIWNAVRRSVVVSYPEGKAAKSNKMPLTSLEPSPDFAAIAGASRAYSERVETGEDFPAALERALHAVRVEKRQALLDVRVAVSDKR
ncbi:MAG: acetolactate synthase [Hyphomicrobiales bacterium]|nr:MAG: acetolactate synthase [Hyphomicrobiales bacterium]